MLCASVPTVPLSALSILMSTYRAMEPYDRLAFRLLAFALAPILLIILSVVLVPVVRLGQRGVRFSRVLALGAALGGAVSLGTGAAMAHYLGNAPEPLAPITVIPVLGLLGTMCSAAGLATVRMKWPHLLGEVW